MSSLRNAVKRIAHKERSQPQARQNLGILEKKKDYKQRSTDFHRKQDRVKAMKQKASMRNPDEFYFGMKNAEVKSGRHRKTMQAQQKEREAEIGPEAVRIMKDQDLSYVRMQKQRDSKKVEKLRASLHYLDAQEENKKRKHTVFVESKNDADEFTVAEHFGTVPELAGRAFNRPRLEMLEKEAQVSATTNADGDELPLTEKALVQRAKNAKRTAKKVAKARVSAYKEMEARTKRVAAMERAEAHLVTEKNLAGKGRKRKIRAAEDGKPAVYKWRRKRLR
jgi:U3 small nucleolar RNA-associated protein 11